MEDEQRFDVRSLAVLRRLREMGLLKKEDIQERELLHWLCSSYTGDRPRKYFPEGRFRFLADWNPDALTRVDSMMNWLPLHQATYQYAAISAFQNTFKAGIRCYPRRKGIQLLFQLEPLFVSNNPLIIKKK